jgi:hypothetical protein
MKFHPPRPMAVLLSAALAASVAGLAFGGNTASAVTPVGSHKGTAAAATPAPKALLGMSAPSASWAQRVSEVGQGLEARRIFVSSLTGSLSLATQACNAGMRPILSFKTGSYTWAQVAAGNADSDLVALHNKLVALPCPVFVAVHHEPAADGTAADWAKMQVRALPILGGTIADKKVTVGVIGNGWWFNTKGGYTDAQIATYVTPGVRAVSDVIAADTYMGSTTTGEGPGPKMVNMSKWATRMGDVRALGIGEFNANTPATISAATNVLATDPKFAWGCVFNSDVGALGKVLTGTRLTAFKTALAGW